MKFSISSYICPQLGSYSGNLTVSLSFDGAVANAGDDEPTVILVGKNGIALQWLDPDPEDVTSGAEKVREVPRQPPQTFRSLTTNFCEKLVFFSSAEAKVQAASGKTMIS